MKENAMEPIASKVARTLEAISNLNPRYRAFSHPAPIDADSIRQLENELASNQRRSGIHGLTVSVKGNIPVKNLPWTEGSAIYAGRIAPHDAAIVQQARMAGGILVGVTTLSELAMYGVENPFEPMGLNPWDMKRTAGGSSTGAGVAAALNLADVNIGTDSGGSIRNPACHCGVVGFMPRIGALSLAGKTNYTPSLSSVSLIARSVSLVTQSFAALSGEGQLPNLTRRLIVPRRLIESMSDAPTRTIFDGAIGRLAAAGFDLIEKDLNGWLDAERAAGVISLFECGQALATMDLARASEGIRRRAATAKSLEADRVANARETARKFKETIRTAMDETGSDAIVTPTWPFAAPLIEADSVSIDGRTIPLDPHRNCFVRAGNAIDACALTLPCGLYPEERVPAGLHLMNSGGHEGRLLALAETIEALMPKLPAPPPVR